MLPGVAHTQQRLPTLHRKGERVRYVASTGCAAGWLLPGIAHTQQRLPPRRPFPADAGGVTRHWHVHRCRHRDESVGARRPQHLGAVDCQLVTGQELADPSEEVGAPAVSPARVAVSRVPAVVFKASSNSEVERRRVRQRAVDDLFGELAKGLEHCGRRQAFNLRKESDVGTSE